MKTLTLILVAVLCAGCVAGSQAADWARLYSKPGVTTDQLNNDGLDCQHGPGEKISTGQAFWQGGLLGMAQGISTPEAHAACMKEKGYTVNTGQQ